MVPALGRAYCAGMIPQLLIASVLFLGSTGDATPATKPTFGAKEAAQMLTGAAMPCCEGATPRQRALNVATQLGDGWQASKRLREVAAMPDSTDAETIRTTIDRIASDLAFEPTNEAPVPKGWLAFTPVGEVRLVGYPKYRMAIVESSDAGEQGTYFWQLFTHIQRNEIPMTAPVEMHLSQTDKGLAMTGMAFLYENPDQPTPAGVRGNVRVVDIEPYEAVNVGLRGEMNDADIKGARELIEGWLKANQDAYTQSGEPRILGYNSPSMPNAKKYYEVQLVVKRKS